MSSSRNSSSNRSTVAALAAALVVMYAFFLFQHGNDQRNSLIQAQATTVARINELDQRTQQIVGDVKTTREIVEVTREAVSAPPVYVVRRESSPQQTSTPAHEAVAPIPESVPVVGPRSGILIGITVDKTQASPGDTLTYHIALKNDGSATVQAHVTSHVPVGTVFLASDDCPPGTLVDACLLMRGQSGQPGQHQIAYDRSIAAGKTNVYAFEVQIKPDVMPGSAITNHAHVRSPNAPSQTSDEVRTVVELTAPKAAGR